MSRIPFILAMAGRVHNDAKTQTRRIGREPAYKLGQRLAMVEPWRTVPELNHLKPRDIPVDMPRWSIARDWITLRDMDVIGKYRYARFMPTALSFQTLEIVSIRHEHLSSISDEDAIREGIACIPKDNGRTFKYGLPDLDGDPGSDNTGWDWQEWMRSPRQAYFKLWEQINGKDSLTMNPVVTVYDFAKVD